MRSLASSIRSRSSDRATPKRRLRRIGRSKKKLQQAVAEEKRQNPGATVEIWAMDAIAANPAFAHACNVGAEVRRPASIAAQQERSEDWFFDYLPSSGNHIYVGESRASLLPDFHYRC
jgi:hypothetical protein